VNHRLLIWILAALNMIGALSIDAYLPALPAIALQFGVSAAIAQQSLTVYIFAFAFMTLFYGTLSDSFGRKPVIQFSLVLYLVSSIGAAFSPSLGWLMAFRTVQGLSAGAGSVVGRAIIGDLLSGAEAQRAMAYTAVIFGMAPAIAPILGGWLQVAYGWRSIFVFIAAFTLILMVVCQIFLQESLPQKDRHPFHFKVIVANYWQVGCHARFMFRCMGNALAFSGIMFYVGAAPAFVMTILHLSAKQFGWLFVPLIGGMTLGSFVSGRLSYRHSSDFMIRNGYVIMVVSAFLSLAYAAIFTVAIPWVILPLFTYGIGMSLALPAMAIVMLQTFPKVRGLASSLMSFTFMIVFAVGAGLICPLVFDSAFHLAATVIVGLCASMLFWYSAMLVHE
jgi:MFS transporter, DHA1 family, multidrug resistance protein